MPAQASLMLNPKYQVMEVQSRFRTYEAPRVLVKPFSLERGFATSAFGETGAAGATGKVLTIEGEEDF